MDPRNGIWANSEKVKKEKKGRKGRGTVKERKATAEWGHERQVDRWRNREEARKVTETCAWWTLLRGAHVAELTMERQLGTR